MKLDAKTINLLGLLTLVVVLGLGAISIVMPMYEGVQTAQTQVYAEREAKNNLQLKLTVLEKSEARQDEIEQNLESLRAKLPNGPESDTVLETIADALESTGVVIASHSVADATLFAPRGEEIAAAPSGEGSPPPADPAVSTSEDIDPEDLADLPPEFVDELQSSSQQVAPEQQQAEIVLEVNVTNAENAAAFLDALGQSPRALLVTGAEMTDSGVEGLPYQLTVALSTFYYDVAVANE